MEDHYLIDRDGSGDCREVMRARCGNSQNKTAGSGRKVIAICGFLPNNVLLMFTKRYKGAREGGAMNNHKHLLFNE